jgi:hypothetical protein
LFGMTPTSRPNFTSRRRGPHWPQHTLLTLEQAVRAVEKQIQHLDQIKTWSETIRGHGDKICERTMRMKTDLIKELERLDEAVTGMHSQPQAGPA